MAEAKRLTKLLAFFACRRNVTGNVKFDITREVRFDAQRAKAPRIFLAAGADQLKASE